MNSIKNPLAVVTGGSSGIGRAIAYSLSHENYLVINADKDVAQIDPSGSVIHLACDITRAEDVGKLSNLLMDHDSPEVLILNAGMGIHEKLREGDPEKWSRVVDVNIMGALRVLRAVLPFMKNGNVIFISSVSSRHAHPYGGVYAATKSAIDTIAETLRLEEQPHIKVSVISPGIVDTPFFENMAAGAHYPHEMGWGAISAEEIAEVVRFILRQKENTAINHITIRPSTQQL
jgi:NADP-dependent 3-hydroxy acid dehydrogenase YdfG